MKKILLLLSTALLFSCGISEESGSISVVGSGTVSAVPDTAQLSVTVSEKAETTKEAQNRVNRKISRIKEVLTDEGIEMRNISTSSIRFANDYVWNDRTRRNEIVGQIVSQTLTIKFEDFDSSPTQLPTVLDILGEGDGLEIGNLGFSISETHEYYQEARRLAFEKARQKAEELASLAGLKLGKAISIRENTAGINPYNGYGMVQRNKGLMEAEGPVPTEIPGGEISINYDISVIFETN